MAGVVNIPWYSTLFRGDRFEVALREIAPISLRYGATGRPGRDPGGGGSLTWPAS